MADQKPKPWERVEGEHERAYAAFQAYLRQPADGQGRSIRRLHADGYGAHKQIGKWSSRFKWQERARLWDDYLAEEAAVAATKEHARRAALWERRRLVDAEKTYSVAGKLRDKAEAMLKHPIRKKRVMSTYPDGRAKTVTVEPAKWTMASAARLAQLAEDLAGKARDTAMNDDEWDTFDPTTASLEECQAFILEQKRRRAAFSAVRFRADVEEAELDRLVREARANPDGTPEPEQEPAPDEGADDDGE